MFCVDLVLKSLLCIPHCITALPSIRPLLCFVLPLFFSSFVLSPTPPHSLILIALALRPLSIRQSSGGTQLVNICGVNRPTLSWGEKVKISVGQSLANDRWISVWRVCLAYGWRKWQKLEGKNETKQSVWNIKASGIWVEGVRWEGDKREMRDLVMGNEYKVSNVTGGWE